MKRKRFIRIAGWGVLLAFAGPCLPNDYFSDLLARAGIAVTGALLSDLLNLLFPAV